MHSAWFQCLENLRTPGEGWRRKRRLCRRIKWELPACAVSPNMTMYRSGTVLDCVPTLLNNFRPSSYVAASNRGSCRSTTRGASKGNVIPSRSYTSEVIKRGGNYLARQSLIFIVVSTASVSCLSRDAPSLLMKQRDISRPRFSESEVCTFFVNQLFALPRM